MLLRTHNDRSTNRRALAELGGLLVLIATLLITVGFRHHVRDPFHGSPSLFVLGPSLRFKEISNASRGTLGSVWGRPHDQKIYDDLFETSTNPFFSSAASADRYPSVRAVAGESATIS